MTKKERERWEKVRKMGRTRYVWVMGVLGWGVTVGVAWSVGMTAMSGDWDRLPLTLGIALVGFPIGGWFFGHFTWKAAEKRYEKALAEDDRR